MTQTFYKEGSYQVFLDVISGSRNSKGRTDVLPLSISQTIEVNFFERATREFNAAHRYQRPLTIILFDVDGFNQINDNLGHAIGDAVLAQVAQVTAAQVRDVDILARYGGDEFIILLPETNSQAAFHIAERVRLGVASIRVTTENEPLSVTLSMGIAETIHTSQGKSIEEVIHHADQTLYKSKKNGRNQTSLFTES